MADYIDVHCHLDSERFDLDREEVISRALEDDIQIIQSGVNSETNRISLSYTEKYGIYCSFGLYPVDLIAGEFPDALGESMRNIVPLDLNSELSWIREHKDSCVAIGEVGLEFKVVDDTPEVRSAQIANFRKIISFANEVDLPLVIHSRGGELECTEIMEEMKCSRVLMHSFNGKKSLIKRGVENGWYFSVPPVIMRLQHFEMMVKIVPLEQLVTETDSPYLSPVYAKRNEPSNVKITVSKIAEIKGLGEEVVRKQLMENAKRLFRI